MLRAVLHAEKSGKKFQLTKEIGGGGEGKVYATDDKYFVAKLFQKPTSKVFDKLECMVRSKLNNSNIIPGKPPLAWPSDILTSSQGKRLGYLMPAVRDSTPLYRIYNSIQRQKHAPYVTWYHLHSVAAKICEILDLIHSEGFVVGDIKQQNILVSVDDTQSITASFIDADSFQIFDNKTKQVFYCDVYTPKMLAPRLIGKDLSRTRRQAHDDYFSLAALLHQILLGVDHTPNAGQWTGRGSDFPPTEELILNNYWCYSNNQKLKPGKASLPIDVLDPELEQLFLRAFNDGHTDPTKRPSPIEWKNTLEAAMQRLHVCKSNSQHLYSSKRGRCGWCLRKKRIKNELFPRVKAQHRFNPALIHGDSFLRAISGDNDKLAVDLWHKWKLWEVGFNSHRAHVERLERRLKKVRRFISMCESGENDEKDVLLPHLNSNRDILNSKSFRTERLNGISAEKYVSKINAIVKTYQIFEHAGFHRPEQKLTVEQETTIVSTWKNYKEGLADSIREKHYQERAERAKQILRRYDSFINAVENNDERRAVRLWKEHKLSRFTYSRRKTLIAEWEKALLKLDDFLSMCRTGKLDEKDALLQYWNKHPSIGKLHARRPEKINGLLFDPYIDKLLRISEIYSSFESAGFDRPKNQLVLQCEQNLISLWEYNKNHLLTSTRKHRYEKRAEFAKETILAYEALAKARKINDESKCVTIWRKHADHLSKLDVVKRFAADFHELTRDYQALDQIESKLKNNSYREAWQLWERRPTLSTRQRALTQFDFTGHKPLKEFIKSEVSPKCQAIDSLDRTLQKKSHVAPLAFYKLYLEEWKQQPAWIKNLNADTDRPLSSHLKLYTHAKQQVDLHDVFYKQLKKSNDDLFFDSLSALLTDSEREIFLPSLNEHKEQVKERIIQALSNNKLISENHLRQNTIDGNNATIHLTNVSKHIEYVVITIGERKITSPSTLTPQEQSSHIRRLEVTDKRTAIQTKRFSGNIDSPCVQVWPAFKFLDEFMVAPHSLDIQFTPPLELVYSLFATSKRGAYILKIISNRATDVVVELIGNPIQHPLTGNRNNIPLLPPTKVHIEKDKCIEIAIPAEANDVKHYTLWAKSQDGNVVLTTINKNTKAVSA